MPDAENQIEILNQPGAPRISDEGLAEYRRLLADQSFATDYPERYAALKASVEQAMRETSHPSTLHPMADPARKSNTTEPMA
jgi:hypothetical protein